MNRISTTLPCAILFLCISLLQWHSLRFWAEAIGPSGYPWSVASEIISLWLWFKPGKRWIRPLAWATTLLLLTGPLYRVTDPLIQEALLKENLSVAISVEKQLLDQAISEKQEELRSFLVIAQTRVGWQGKINEAQAALEMKRERLTELFANGHTPTHTEAIGNISRLSWQRRAIIIMQLLSILIFQATIILSIITLSKSYHQNGNVSGNVSRYGEVLLHDKQVATLLNELSQKIQQELQPGKSQAEIARSYNIAPRYITHILNYEKYEIKPLNLTQLRRLAVIFQITVE